ncbi:MAG: hypothetical protein ACFFDF_11035 [Candidatus Odinarchaeota archaeon]
MDLLNLLISVMFAFAHDNDRKVLPLSDISLGSLKDLKKGITPSRALFADLILRTKNLVNTFASKAKKDAITKIDNYIKALKKYRASDIGCLFHVIIEDIVIKGLKTIGDTNINCFYEVLSKTFNPTIDRGFTVDLIIHRDNEIREKIEGSKHLQKLKDPKEFRYYLNLIIPNFGSKIKFITLDFTMSEDINDVLEKLDKGYFSDDMKLLIVLYNKKRSTFALSWKNIIKRQAGEYSDNVDIMTIEDLAIFLNLNLDLISDVTTLLELKDKSLAGDEKSFVKLLNMKDIGLVNLRSMKGSQFWFDKFLGAI